MHENYPNTNADHKTEYQTYYDESEHFTNNNSHMVPNLKPYLEYDYSHLIDHY